MRRLASVVISLCLGLGAPAQAALAGMPEPARLTAPPPPPPPPAPPAPSEPPPPAPIAASDVAALNLRAQALPRAYVDLLSKNAYDLRADGTVWTPNGKVAVSQSEMPVLLHRLESAQRLRALLQLDMLLSNSDGEKYLTPVERDNLRKIVRENWPFFTLGTRKDFKHFYSLQELEEMNRDPAPTDTATALMMIDPEPQDYTNAELPPALKPVPVPRLLPAPLPPQPVYAEGLAPQQSRSFEPTAPAVYYVSQMPGGAGLPPAPAIAPAPAAVPAAAPAAAAVAGLSAGFVPPVPTPLPVPTPVPAPVASPIPALVAAAPAPVAASKPAPAAAAATALPTAPVATTFTSIAAQPPAPIVVTSLPESVTPAAAYIAAQAAQAQKASVAAPAVAVAQSSGVGLPAPVQAAVTSAAGPPTRVAPAPQPPAPPPAAVVAPLPPTQPIAEAGLPPVRLISADEFEHFLTEAPYGHDAKGLLRVVAQKAMEPSRSRALGALMNYLPQIVFDTARAGLDSHAALLAIETPEMHAYTIALSPGPILVSKKKMFGAETLIMVSDSSKVYASLHAPTPAIEALKHESVASTQGSGEWGPEKVYSDESRRGTYSPQEQAGYLLRKLLRLDAKRGGWDASAYAAEAYARSAQWILYSRVQLDLKDDSFLDPETRATFRQWRDHPAEYRDLLIATLAAGRVQTLDPRKGNAETQTAFDRAALSDCVGTFKTDIEARLAADREALKKDAQALERAGLIESGQLEEARKAIDADFGAVRLPQPTPEQCAGRYASEADALRASAALFAEMNQSERSFRGATP